MNKLQQLLSILITFVFLISLLQDGKTQDPIFSQYYMVPTLHNPALVGQVNGPRFGLIYRNQWPAISNAYETYAFTYDQYVESIHSGFGFSILSDHAGDGILTSQKIEGQYAYRLETQSGWKAQLALSVGAGQQRIDQNSLIFLDQLDPQFGATSPGGTPYPTEEPPLENNSTIYLDIGTGASFYNETYFFTVGVAHLNRPVTSFREQDNGSVVGLPMKYTIMMGSKYVINEGTTYNPAQSYLSPTILFARQGGTGQINAGLFYGFGRFSLGGFYRHAFTNPDAIGATVGVNIGNVRIGYAYDFTISDLGISTGGSHELGITLAIDRKRYKYEDCYDMFR